MVTVSYEASDMSGTSARLKEGDELRLLDLLYGLMLPSGNDAGYLIAEYLGEVLSDRGVTRLDLPTSELGITSDLDLDDDTSEQSCASDTKYLHWNSYYSDSPIQYFIMEMNYYALEVMGLKNTMFDSPHGLNNYRNYSSAADLA